MPDGTTRGAPIRPDPAAISEFAGAMFRHADPAGFVAARSFYDDKKNGPPFQVMAVAVREAPAAVVRMAEADPVATALREASDLPDELRRKGAYSTAEASRVLEALGVPAAPATLNKWRHTGGGPPFWKPGANVRYPRPELVAWAIQRRGLLRCSTSDRQGT